METYRGAMWILGVLAAVLTIGALRSRLELVINFVLRGILGMLLIYFANYFLADRMPGLEVGYNLVTILTSGVLGVPGVLLLYGVNFYFSL